MALKIPSIRQWIGDREEVRRQRLIKFSPGLRSLAKDRGWRIWDIAPATEEVRSPSRTLPEQFEEVLFTTTHFLGHKRTKWDHDKLKWLYGGEIYPTNEVFLVEVPNAYVQTRTGAVFLDSKTIIPESCLASSGAFRSVTDAEIADAPLLSGHVSSLLTVWGFNYAHWLFDALPKLMVLEEVAPEISTRLLVPTQLSSFQEQSLELLGWPDLSLVSPANPLVKVEKLLLAVASGRSGVPNPVPLKRLRRRLLKEVNGESSSGDKRIYIPRRSPSRFRSQRRITNESELLQTINSFGFQTLLPETLTFAQQVKEFTNASCILGPHGAGIYNHLFAPEEIPVIELFNPLYWDHTGIRLTSLFKQPHWHLFGRNLDAADNYSINPDRFKRLLQVALG